jgi:hypothetical protein
MLTANKNKGMYVAGAAAPLHYVDVKSSLYALWYKKYKSAGFGAYAQELLGATNSCLKPRKASDGFSKGPCKLRKKPVQPQKAFKSLFVAYMLQKSQ